LFAARLWPESRFFGILSKLDVLALADVAVKTLLDVVHDERPEWDVDIAVS